MRITREMKMAEMIHLNHLLLGVIDRFGLKIGFGEKTIEDLCRDHELNVDFFLEICNAYIDEHYFPKVQLQAFPISNIVAYLKKTHSYYLGKILPEIDEYIVKLENATFEAKPNVGVVKSFFENYKEEVTTHIMREEDRVFPYVLKIEEAHKSLKLSNELKKEIENYSINHYYDDHDDVEEKLYDLKNIIIKYLPQPEEIDLIHKLINSLFSLEKDLNDHSRIEDKVLVPKVAVMERELLAIYQSQNNQA